MIVTTIFPATRGVEDVTEDIQKSSYAGGAAISYPLNVVAANVSRRSICRWFNLSSSN